MKISSLALAVVTATAQTIDLHTYQSILTSELDTHALEDALVAYDAEADFLNEMNLAEDDASRSGYLVCNSAAGIGGHQRKLAIRKALNIPHGVRMQAVYNKDDRTCVMASIEHGAMRSYVKSLATTRDDEKPPTNGPLEIQPMTSYMKMRKGLVEHVEESSNDAAMHKQLAVDFCSASIGFDSSQALAEELLERVTNQRDGQNGRSLALQKFAWSSDSMHRHMRRHLKSSQSGVTSIHERWSRALAQGLDADHRCRSMLDDVEFSFSSSNKGMFIDLGHGAQDDVASASNADCVLSVVAALSAQPEVCGISSNVMPKPLNDIAQWITQSGITDQRPFWDAGITGDGEIVQVSDTGLDTNHCMFWDSTPGEQRDGSVDHSRRKVVQYVNYQDDSDYTDGHGTHVVGSILGNRSTDGTVGSADGGVLAGMAKNAKVSFFDLGAGTACCYVPYDSSLFRGYGEAGAKIHSASWGNTDSSYSSLSVIFDSFAYDHDDFLPIVAAGNSGTASNTVGSPATAKNILSVGAGESSGRDLYATGAGGMNYLAYFSSRGPTNDGRMKPDIVAPGHSILSAGARPSSTGECEGPAGSFPSAGGSSSYGIKYMSGTSMATPVTSGNAAMVREYFEKGFNPIGVEDSGYAVPNPSAALVRATIYNGAQAMTAAQTSWYGGGSTQPVSFYDDNIGFGRVNLITSLPLDGVTDFTYDAYDRVSISNGEAHEYTYDINTSCDNTDEISATLVWTDPENSSGCTNCVLNDLDLEMSINGVVYFANGGTSPDTKNNAERIRKGTSAGDFVQLKVSGTNLSTSSQKYALIVTGCFGGEGYPTRSPTKSPSPSISPAPTKSPTSSPTGSPTVHCDDYPNWTDSYGDGCEWYETYDQPGCPSYGNYFDGGLGTPNEACCYCGGGNAGTTPPVASPSHAPTFAPTTGSGDTCSQITEKRECNKTEGCGYNSFDNVCKAALSTEECSAFDGKRRKCKKNGCKWRKNTSTCKGRWD
jgi:hypothetical protein